LQYWKDNNCQIVLGILKNEKLLVDVLSKNKNDFYKNIDFISSDLIVEWSDKSGSFDFVKGWSIIVKMVRT